MKPAFWLEKWQANEIGFHQAEVHELLHNWSRLGLEPGTRILVPLCGKSVDMIWLAEQGHSVVGIELSDIAARAFFQENDLEASTETIESFTRYSASNIEIWAGDFFAIESQHLGRIDAIYDRAALIALPISSRQAYISKCGELGGQAHKTLLIGLEYLPDAIVPPPFSMSRSDIEAVYGFGYSVEHLETRMSDIKGLPARETAYRITKRDSKIDVAES